jgi:hypothetical protein
MTNYRSSKHRVNKFTDGGGTAGSIGKFIVGVGLILGVVAFVLVLTRKCKPCEAFDGGGADNEKGVKPIDHADATTTLRGTGGSG